MLHPGQVIDRYEVEAVLGEGGMAVVYRVTHTTLGSTHALKVLTIGGKAVRERLLAEGRVQAGIDHPNALTVTDVIDVDGAPGLVMEFVAGGSLDEWIEREDPSRAERLAVFRSACSAVAEAHRRGWVHRDLKPGNILIKETRDGIVPKVADFGLVKAVVGDQPLKKGRTREGVAMGTPGFMAPEQIADAATVGVQADVFSLGCVLVWLLTGEGPFDGDTPLEIFGKVASHDYASLPPTDPLFALSERCLASEPSDRPADAGALIEALDAAPTSFIAPPAEPKRNGVEAPVDAAGLSGAQKAVFGAMVVLAGVLSVAVVLGLLGLCGVGQFAGYLVQERASRCSLYGTGRLGYAEVVADDASPPPLRSKLTLEVEAEVVKDPDGPRSVVCVLPAGSTIRVREPIENGYVAVYRESTNLPTP